MDLQVGPARLTNSALILGVWPETMSPDNPHPICFVSFWWIAGLSLLNLKLKWLTWYHWIFRVGQIFWLADDPLVTCQLLSCVQILSWIIITLSHRRKIFYTEVLKKFHAFHEPMSSWDLCNCRKWPMFIPSRPFLGNVATTGLSRWVSHCLFKFIDPKNIQKW